MERSSLKINEKTFNFWIHFFSIHEKITACAINAIHVQLHTFQLIFFFNFWNLCPSTALPIVMFNYDVTMGKNTQSNIKKKCLTSDIHLVLNQTCDKFFKKIIFLFCSWIKMMKEMGTYFKKKMKLSKLNISWKTFGKGSKRV